MNTLFSSVIVSIGLIFGTIQIGVAQAVPENEITATITAQTSEKELSGLIDFMEDHGMELSLKKQKRNGDNLLTALSITLKNDSQTRQYAVSSSTPIRELELGSKDGRLFIEGIMQKGLASGGGGAMGNLATGNSIQDLMQQFGFDMDMDFNFDKDSDSLSFNGAFDLNKIRKQMQDAFSYDEDSGTFSFNGNKIQINPSPGNSQQLPPKSTLPKYSFIDRPDITKLILIDGKESDFETLDKLAKADQLQDVDFLKSSTAVSIYGSKAKDGAIIATVKKQE